MNITTKTAKFDTPLYLESGRLLETYEIIYETYGEMNDDKSNIIIVTHALSGSHHAAGYYEGDRKPGYWNDLNCDSQPKNLKKIFGYERNFCLSHPDY